MKQLTTIFILGFFWVTALAQQETRMPLIGETAPEMTVQTTHGELDFPEYFEGRWVILFSHPGAFTPICTSEFMAMQERIGEFDQLNCELIGLSTDGLNAQYEWVRSIRDDIEFKGMKDVEITFPIIADPDLEFAAAYGMIHPQISPDKTVRSVFYIDPAGTVRAIMYYPVSNGRSVDEMIRLLEALQVTDKYDVATPSDWTPGESVFIPPPHAGAKASKEYSKAMENDQCPAWYMCLKQLPQKKSQK